MIAYIPKRVDYLGIAAKADNFKDEVVTIIMYLMSYRLRLQHDQSPQATPNYDHELGSAITSIAILKGRR